MDIKTLAREKLHTKDTMCHDLKNTTILFLFIF